MRSATVKAKPVRPNHDAAVLPALLAPVIGT
jgi:hypothetical protein